MVTQRSEYQVVVREEGCPKQQAVAPLERRKRGKVSKVGLHIYRKPVYKAVSTEAGSVPPAENTKKCIKRSFRKQATNR